MILLDTHVVLWLVNDAPSLGTKSRSLISSTRAAGELAVSAITFWEIALLVEKGRLQLSDTPTILRDEFLATGAQELPVDGTIALVSAALPHLHGDPADRFIVASATIHRAMLVTADRALLEWEHPIGRHDART